MDVYFIDVHNNEKIVLNTDISFIPIVDDCLDINDSEYIVIGRNINYDRMIVEIYIKHTS